MKKITALFFLLVGLNANAQNWKLLDENKTYFYKHSDSLLITNTIKIDSTVNSALDSVFHIHTTIKVCDTCTVIPSEAFGGVLYHAYAPEIFGNTPTFNVSTNDYQFSDGIIKPDAELSDTWIFNASLSINATVVEKYETTLFGSLDSIKVIELSTLDTILISKNHGVIRYPDFENAGKYFLLCGYHEGQNSYGEYLPNMWRIYDFNVGDVFYLNHNHGWIDLDQCEEGIKSKFTVVSNLSNSTVVTYEMNTTHGHYESCNFDYYLIEYTTNGTCYYSVGGSNSYYENNYSGITPPYLETSFFPDPFYAFHYSSYRADSPDILDSTKRHFITHYYDGMTYIKKLATMYAFTDSLFFISSTPGNSESLEFKEGFGRINLEISQFEDIKSDDLSAWIKNGDTTGYVYQFAGLESTVNNQLLFHPNPATDLIELNQPLHHVYIYSFSGELVLKIENSMHGIYVGNLSKGIYMLIAVDMDGNHLTTKLVLE